MNLLGFFHNKYLNYTNTDLVAELNRVEPKKANLLELVYLITRLVYFGVRYSQINFNLTSRNLDSVTSVVIATLVKKATSSEEISLKDIFATIDQELNLTIDFHFSNGKLIGDLNQVVNGDGDSDKKKLLIKLFKEELLSNCPDQFKLLLVSLFQTGEVSYAAYSPSDRFLFKEFMKTTKLEVDELAIKLPNFDQLVTLQKQTIFLILLKEKAPDIFVLLGSMKEVPKSLLLVELGGTRHKLNEVLALLDDTAKEALNMFNDNLNFTDSKFFNLMKNVARTISFDLAESKVSGIFDKQLDMLFSENEKQMECIMKQSDNVAAYLQTSKLLNTAIGESLTLVKNLQSLTGSETV